MAVTIQNIAARDLLPGQKDYKNILIATASASSSTGNENDAGNVLDSNETTKWRSRGMDESVTLQLSDAVKVHRVDIEWDPDLSRTGRFSVEVGEDFAWASANMDGSLFTSIEDVEGVETDRIKIVCGGNADNDLNGITNVAVYGYDSNDKPMRAAAEPGRLVKTATPKAK